ncbi:MAG: hypothetical protein WBW33_03875 [Bryobacteraceae bacterium]|jgi:hypothetical protein
MTPHGLPSELYHCLLDEQPYYLAPPALMQNEELLGTVVVNPSCWFAWDGPLPPHMAARIDFNDAFYSTVQMAWVQDPATLAIWPFWVGDEFFEYLSRLTPGSVLQDDLPAHVRWVLTEANILVAPNHTGQRRRVWRSRSLSYAKQFENGYVAVPGLIHPFHVGALRRYYRCRTRQGWYLFGDEQVRRRFAAHNEAIARFIHEQLTHAISDIACTVLKPSYAYFVSYMSGAELEEHVDRAQCDYSITACIDATPEPRAESPWPIRLGSGDGKVAVYQHLGDALLYRGCQVPHSRDRLPEGFTSTSLLLHYVEEPFGGSLN